MDLKEKDLQELEKLYKQDILNSVCGLHKKSVETTKVMIAEAEKRMSKKVGK